MKYSLIILAVFVISSTACSSRYSAPVDQIGGGPRFLDDGKLHRVNGGETLYAIAWMYDLDVNALARANSLQQPYTVTQDQILTVDPRAIGGNSTAGTGNVPATGTATVRAVPVNTGLSRTPLPASGTIRQPLPEPETPRQPAAPATNTLPPVTGTSPPAANSPATTPPATVTRVPDAEPVTAPVASSGQFSGETEINWDWPYRGTVVGRFADTAVEGKGLDLGGTAGDSILAAADGEVVYAGSGLLRYGNLLILKHNDHFLSAYAHNRALLVKEGEVVRRGQTIAELGSSGVDRNMLHFEIRQDGKPVDPQLFLPAR